MRDARSVPASSGYVVTEQGKLDLQCAPRCNCNPRLAGLLIECRECGTVYGSLRENAPWEPSRGKRD